MRPPYIFLFVLFLATSLGTSGCGLMEHFKNPNSLANRVGNFSSAKINPDKTEKPAAKQITPLIRGSRDLDGRQEQFDPAFGAPETQAELNQERAQMNAARRSIPSAQNMPVGQPPGVGTNAVSSPDGTAPLNTTNPMNASAGTRFGSPSTGGPSFSAPRTASNSATNNLATTRSPLVGQSAIGTSTFTDPARGFAGQGSQFGSPNTSNSTTMQKSSMVSSGKLNSTSSGVPSHGSSSAPGGNSRASTGSSSTAKHSPTAIVQSPDSSRFGLAHGSVKPTTFAPTRSNTPIADLPSQTANFNQNQGFGCPPAGMVSLGRTSGSQGSNQFGMTNGAPRSLPAVSQPMSSSSSIPIAGNSGNSPRFDSSLPPVDLSMMRGNSGSVSAPNQAGGNFETAPPTNMSRLESQPTVQTSNGWDFKSFRLPTFKFPFFPSSKSKSPKSSPEPASDANANDLEIVNAQNSHSRDVPVTITAVVKKLLPDDTRGNPHQRFLLGLSNGTTVLVAHNISLAPYVPLREGDYVTISGEYIWNEKGGVLHYTHHTTNRKHRGGYIEYNRQTYQ